jgi:aspartokinase/homoserine dehydrogenase 1
MIRGEHSSRAVRALEETFALELGSGVIQRVWSESDVSVLAAVGEGMVGTPGVSARLFGALAAAGVNIRAIAQGASERSISAAVPTVDADRALRAAHGGFYLSPQTISLAVIGPGNVGRALLEQIRVAAPRLHASHGLDLRLRLLMGTRRSVGDPLGLDWSSWERAYSETAETASLDTVAPCLRDAPWPHAAVIDLSASDEVADRYAEWLAAGIHVITPNKRAGSGPAERYRAIQHACTTGRALFKCEATVGAGLPIVGTVRDLVHTGDEVDSIECVLSGTLAWLLNGFDGRSPFSELVREARERGFTEPDPRDDLSGMDVARKLVILAREIGAELDLDHVEVRSLVPEAIASVPLEEALARLETMDEPMAAELSKAADSGVLRHVATLSRDGRAEVGLRALSATHAFAHLRGTDNCVQFRTSRYRDNPLVVQGPGAGPDVTAAGVFSDLLRLAAHLGARL